MHCFGTPEEITKVLLFFATEESSFILGEELVVDGDFTLYIQQNMDHHELLVRSRVDLRTYA